MTDMTSLDRLTAQAHSRFPEQHYAKVTNDLRNIEQRELRPGDVIYERRWGLRLLWSPKGGNYTQQEKESLVGFYTIPDYEDFVDMCLNEAYTPADDCVEPDHPDAWPRLLGFV